MGLGFELVGGEVSESGVFVDDCSSLRCIRRVPAEHPWHLQTAALKHLALEGGHEGFRPGALHKDWPVRTCFGADRHVPKPSGRHRCHTGCRGRYGRWLPAPLAAPARPAQGMDDEFRPHVRGQIPTHNTARAKINDHGEVKPACGGGDEGDVPSPGLIRLLRQGLTASRLAQGRSARPSLVLGRKFFGWIARSCLCFMIRRSLEGAHTDVMIAEFLTDPAVAVTATITFKNLLNEPAHADVFMMSWE